jgi:hypothetical protein
MLVLSGSVDYIPGTDNCGKEPAAGEMEIGELIG